MAAEHIDVVASYLTRPYTRLVVPEDDGTFRAEMLEFPGCIATGDTAAEAMSALEDTAMSWLASALAHKQSIPEPIDSHDFSGRLVVRFPRSLHKKATLIAELDGISLNQLIIASLAEYVGERSRPINAAPAAGRVTVDVADVRPAPIKRRA
jgi:predicted RNase H-like HicB family nuclease